MDKTTKDWFQYGLAGLIVIGFFILLGLLMVLVIPVNNEKALELAIGSLLMAFGTVVGYFFGSSKGSAEKNEIIAGTTDKQ